MDLKLAVSEAREVCRQHYLTLLLVASVSYPVMFLEGYLVIESQSYWLMIATAAALALVNTVPIAATVYAAAVAILGGKPSFGESYDAVLDRLGTLLTSEACYFVPAVLLVWSIVGIPLMAFIALRWLFSKYAVVLEDLPTFQALSRSNRLVKAAPVRPMWWALTLGVIPHLPNLAAFITANALAVAVAPLFVVIAQPFTTTLMTAVFIQLRNAEPLAAPAS